MPECVCGQAYEEDEGICFMCGARLSDSEQDRRRREAEEMEAQLGEAGPECACGALIQEGAREWDEEWWNTRCPECELVLREDTQYSYKKAGEEKLAEWLRRLGWRETEGAGAGGEGGWTPGEDAVRLIETLADYTVDHAEREAIVERIVEEEDQDVIRALVKVVDHEVRHRYLQNVTLRVLRALRPREAVPVLVERWEDEEVHEILKAYPSYPEMLVDAMRHGSDRPLEERREAVEMREIGLMGPESRDRWLRRTIAVHLGRQGDERAVGPLLELLEGSTGTAWKKAAEALLSLDEESAIPLLVNRLTTDRASDHREIVDLLRRYDPYPGMLVEALEREDEVRFWAAIHLADSEEDERAIPALEAALEDGDETVRREAAFALAELGERKTAVGPLVEILEAPVDETSRSRRGGRRPSKRRAAKTLGEWRAEEAVPGLLVLLGDVGSWTFRPPGPNSAALAALENYPSYPDLLEEGVDHPDPEVRYWAAVQLAEERGLRGEEVIDPDDVDRLIGELRSDDLDESWEAARKLGHLRARAAVDALVEQLGIVEKNYARFATTGVQFADEGDAHVGAYAEALVEIGDPTAVPAALDVLEGSSGWVARDSAHVVRGLLDGLDGVGEAVPTDEAVAAMIATLKRSRVASGMKYGLEQRMRLELTGAIARLADASAIPALEEALENETDTEVRSALADCLEDLER